MRLLRASGVLLLLLGIVHLAATPPHFNAYSALASIYVQLAANDASYATGPLRVPKTQSVFRPHAQRNALIRRDASQQHSE